MGYELCSSDDFSTFLPLLPTPFLRSQFPVTLVQSLRFHTFIVKYLGDLFYRPLIPKLNADPASATDIPKKNPLGAGAE